MFSIAGNLVWGIDSFFVFFVLSFLSGGVKYREGGDPGESSIYVCGGLIFFVRPNITDRFVVVVVFCFSIRRHSLGMTAQQGQGGHGVGGKD